MNDYIFACFSKKTYYYLYMKKYILFLLLTVAAYSGKAQVQNYKLQSVFIYSFTRYIQWPDDYNQGDFDIHVLGDSPIFTELQSMAQVRKVGADRQIKVTKINSLAEIKKCNILFVSSKSASIADVLGKMEARPTLVVTEEPGLAAKGSDINFVVKDSKPAFELNQTAINKRGFKISLELIRLAILI